MEGHLTMNDLIQKLSALLRQSMQPIREIQKSAEFDAKLTLSEVLEKLIQAQGIVMDIQARYQDLQSSKDELDKRLAQYAQWTEDSSKYAPFRLKSGCTVIVLKEGQHTGYAKDWYCKHCFDNKRKSQLQAKSWCDYFCPQCQTPYQIGNDDYEAVKLSR
jgi:hypothetical protein